MLRSPKAGINIGLSLELFAGVTDSIPAAVKMSGLVVAIYNASMRPSFTEESMRIRPGQETTLMISRQERQKLARPYSECIVNVTDPLAFDSDEYRYTVNFGRYYRQKVCISTCSTRGSNASSLQSKNRTI